MLSRTLREATRYGRWFRQDRRRRFAVRDTTIERSSVLKTETQRVVIVISSAFRASFHNLIVKRVIAENQRLPGFLAVLFCNTDYCPFNVSKQEILPCPAFNAKPRSRYVKAGKNTLDSIVELRSLIESSIALPLRDFALKNSSN